MRQTFLIERIPNSGRAARTRLDPAERGKFREKSARAMNRNVVEIGELPRGIRAGCNSIQHLSKIGWEIDVTERGICTPSLAGIGRVE